MVSERSVTTRRSKLTLRIPYPRLSDGEVIEQLRRAKELRREIRKRRANNNLHQASRDSKRQRTQYGNAGAGPSKLARTSCPNPAKVSSDISAQVNKPKSTDETFIHETAKELVNSCNPQTAHAIVDAAPVRGWRAITLKKAIMYFIGLGLTASMAVEWGGQATALPKFNSKQIGRHSF